MNLRERHLVVARHSEDAHQLLQGPSPLRQSHLALALDADSYGLLTRAGHEVTCYDDWLTDQERLWAFAQGEHANASWAEGETDATLRHLAQIDRESSRRMWVDAHTALAYARAFRRNAIKTVTISTHDPPRPSMYAEPADTMASVWHVVMPESLLRVSEGASYSRWSPAFLRIRRRASTASAALLRRQLPKGGYLVAVNPYEAFRFAPAVRRLRQAGQPVTGIVLTESIRLLQKVRQLWRVPVGLPPTIRTNVPTRVGHIPADLSKIRLMVDVEQSLQRALWPQLDWRINFRWSALQESLEQWMRLLDHMRPEVVVVSDLADAESQVPALAAKALSIPSVALPHGLLMSDRPSQSPSIQLYGTELQLQLYGAHGTPVKRLIACADAALEDEYYLKPLSLPRGRSGQRVLVLLEPTTLPGTATPRVSPTAHSRALVIIQRLANSTGLTVMVKLHPKYPEQEFLRGFAPGLEPRLLPLDASLQDCLAWADAVVAVNYIGSALAHAAMARVPIIHLRTDVLMARPGFPASELARLVSEWGPVSTSLDQLLRMLARVSHEWTSSKYARKIEEGLAATEQAPPLEMVLRAAVRDSRDADTAAP